MGEGTYYIDAMGGKHLYQVKIKRVTKKPGNSKTAQLLSIDKAKDEPEIVY